MRMMTDIAKCLDVRALNVDQSRYDYVSQLCSKRLSSTERPIVVAERNNRVTNDPSRNSDYEWLVRNLPKAVKETSSGVFA